MSTQWPILNILIKKNEFELNSKLANIENPHTFNTLFDNSLFNRKFN